MSTPLAKGRTAEVGGTEQVNELVEQFNKASINLDLKDSHCINILLLGETGVGKSTWINGFTNYLRFATLEEAVASEELIVPIPTSFTIKDPTTKVNRTVQAGRDDNNEVRAPGASATQSPRSYKFSTADGRGSICIIDTPGIGDTGGLQKDLQNLEQIMFHLGTITNLHGICILMKPNVTRLTPNFKFCIKELLTRLHTSATANVVFCFTNGRAVDYQLGDTVPNLGALLSPEGSLNTGILLTDNTLYCVDNEAVHYLAGMKSGVAFSAKHVENYRESWSHSVAEMNRLLQHVAGLPFHDASSTRLLNEARDMVSQITRPLAELSGNIMERLNEMKKVRAEMNSDKAMGDALKVLIQTTVMDIKMEPSEPIIVCTAASCIEKIHVDGQLKINYKTRCHSPCGCSGVLAETVGASGLWRCSAFELKIGGLGFYCKRCKCSWDKHMRTMYECVLTQTKMLDQGVLDKLDGIHDEIQKKRVALDELKERIQELKDEQSKVLKLSSKFAHFLRHSAISYYNDSMLTYLDLQIEGEKNRLKGFGPSQKLIGLQAIYAAYEEELKVLEKVEKEQAVVVKAEDIAQLIEEAYKLPLSGKKLKEYMGKRRRMDMRYKNDALMRGTGQRSWVVTRVNEKQGNSLQEQLRGWWARVTGGAGTDKQQPPVAKPRADKQPRV